MTPRHALQSAAKQFGADGTDRSLRELLHAIVDCQLERVLASIAAVNPAAVATNPESWSGSGPNAEAIYHDGTRCDATCLACIDNGVEFPTLEQLRDVLAENAEAVG